MVQQLEKNAIVNQILKSFYLMVQELEKKAIVK
jgi:hypothetical protein